MAKLFPKYSVRQQLILFTVVYMVRDMGYVDLNNPPNETKIASCIEYVKTARFIGDSAVTYYNNLSDTGLKQLVGAVRNAWKQRVTI
jgi:hypothetical protein